MSKLRWNLTYTYSQDCTPGISLHSTTPCRGHAKLIETVPSSGECAGHFRQILVRFPPQVTTRSNAATWACHVHNQVNKSLQKPDFDCSKIGDFYDCGCAEDDAGTSGAAKVGSEEATVKGDEMSKSRIEKITAENGRDLNWDLLKGKKEDKPLEVEKEG